MSQKLITEAVKAVPADEVAKAIPATALIGTYFAGISLNDWVLYGSGVLILLQIFFLLKGKLWDNRKK